MNPFYTMLIEQALLPLLGIVITSMITWAAARFNAWTGINIEAKHREALQSALLNGVRYAIQQLSDDNAKGISINLTDREWQERIINSAINYVTSSVPDAVDYFRLWGEGQLRQLILPKIPILTEEQARDAVERETGRRPTNKVTIKSN